MGGGWSLIVHEAGKAYLLTTKPGDAYDNQVADFVDCVRKDITHAHGAPAEHLGEATLIMKQTAGKATINPLVAMSRNPEIRPSDAC
jgi:hypothetical protein